MGALRCQNARDYKGSRGLDFSLTLMQNFNFPFKLRFNFEIGSALFPIRFLAALHSSASAGPGVQDGKVCYNFPQ